MRTDRSGPLLSLIPYPSLNAAFGTPEERGVMAGQLYMFLGNYEWLLMDCLNHWRRDCGVAIMDYGPGFQE